MQIGEEKKDGSQYQDLFLQWQEERSLIRQRSKGQLPYLPLNRNTWLSFTLSRSRYGFSVFSKKSATTSAIKTSSTPTIKARLHSHTIRNTTPVQSTSISNITSSETALKMERHSWNIVQRRIW